MSEQQKLSTPEALLNPEAQAYTNNLINAQAEALRRARSSGHRPRTART